MRDIVDQLEQSMDSGNYYLSLFMALALPDIAGALDSDDGLASKAKYIDWYEAWGRPRFMDVLRDSLPEHVKEHISDMENPMDGESCYLFRCSMLHQGKTVHPKNKYSRIIFIEPRSTTNVVHYGVMNDTLCIDLPSFCKEMILGLRMWLDAVENTDKYQKNYKDFVQRHPGGLKPFIGGVPVIG